MSVTMLISDIIKVGTSTVIFSSASKVVGQKNISDMIKFSGWMCIGLDLFLLIQPLLNFLIQCGEKVANIAERIGQALSLVGL